MTVTRRFLLLAALAVTLHAETVYLSANGKTYHAADKCMSLAKAKAANHVLRAERADAEKHGLKPCGICYREKKSAKESKNAWAVKP